MDDQRTDQPGGLVGPIGAFWAMQQHTALRRKTHSLRAADVDIAWMISGKAYGFAVAWL